MQKVNFKSIAAIILVLILKHGVVKSQTITVSSFTKEENKAELRWLQKRNKQYEEYKRKQEQNDSIDDVEVVFIIVEGGHTFQGQVPEIGFPRYIEHYIKYPKEAIKEDVEGTIIVKFNVEPSGNIVETHILRGINPELNNEIVQVINSSPKWSPGRAGGRVFRQTYILTIDFRLNDTHTHRFNGGAPEIEFRKYIEENIKYPQEAIENAIAGVVLVKFTVTKKGKVKDAHILKGSDFYLNKEAIRVISNSPNWDIPRLWLKPKARTFIFPVTFKIPKDNQVDNFRKRVYRN
jgi:TonB family protein